jgi:hypothetical protein
VIRAITNTHSARQQLQEPIPDQRTEPKRMPVSCHTVRCDYQWGSLTVCSYRKWLNCCKLLPKKETTKHNFLSLEALDPVQHRIRSDLVGCLQLAGDAHRFPQLKNAPAHTLGPLNNRALNIFLGYTSPCLMDLFTPKKRCRCLPGLQHTSLEHVETASEDDVALDELAGLLELLKEGCVAHHACR